MKRQPLSLPRRWITGVILSRAVREAGSFYLRVSPEPFGSDLPLRCPKISIAIFGALPCLR